jgi:uncharacterized protein (PEP-CTERM system associated)
MPLSRRPERLAPRLNAPTPAIRTPVALAACLLLALPAQAQTSGITPSFRATTTYSDNDGGSSGGTDGVRDRQFITQLSPGLSWFSRSGRVQGSANYALNANYYSRQSEAKTFQNSLAARLTAEAIEDFAFIDATASIAQSAISAFGTQAVGNGFQADNNRTEVRTVSISPYLRGQLGGWANYQARYTVSATSAPDSTQSDSVSRGAGLSLSSANSGAVFGWGLDASSQETEFDGAEPGRTDRLTASLLARPVLGLQLGLSGGQESTDLVGERRSYDNWGYSVRWQPSPRTDFSLSSDRRFFGNAHALSISHRLRRSTFRYNDTRGTTGDANPAGVGQPTSLFQVFDAIFTAQQPDPDLRRQQVLDFIASLGRDPGELVSGGFLTQAVSLQRRQDLSYGWAGRRNSLSVQAFRSRTGTLRDAEDSTTPRNEVLQTGYSWSASHRLTPWSSLSLTGSRQMTKALGGQEANDLKSAALSWSSQVSRMANTAVTARYSVFNSPTSPYREAALSASLALRF